MTQFFFNGAIFGRDIRRERVAHELTQDDVATLLGVHGSTVSRWECGTTTGIYVANLIAVCDLLDLDPRDYFQLLDMSNITVGGE